MSELEALAMRCLLPGFAGLEPPEWVRRRVAAGLGGVVLYARNVDRPDQLQRLTESIHAERGEVLIAIDEEGGDITRLEATAGSSYPGNLALGTAGDTALTRDVAAAIGTELHEAGVDLDLAPDADVNSNPLNPVIGVRSFGSDPVVVGDHVAAWVEGLQGAGVAACAKHFPGHGDTAVDSHLELPVVLEDPHVRALAPFAAAIAAGVHAIMSAHIMVPSIDGELPATLSPRIMTGLLREQMQFTGLAITDGLEMRALTGRRSLVDNAVLALAAGCDAICVGGGLMGEDTVNELVHGIVAAVADGRLNADRLEEAARRVDALGALQMARRRSSVAVAPSSGVGLAAARRAVRREGDVQIGDAAVVVRLHAPASIAAGEVPWGVGAELIARGVAVDAVELDGHPADVDAIVNRAVGKSLVIEARGLHAHAHDARTVDAILARRKDAVVIEMGWPGHRPADARRYIVTHGSARVCGVAASEVMRP